jgi:hypothetical protein
MAISTISSYLMEGTGSGTLTWAKLVDIKDYPDMVAPPEQLQATTLSDEQHWYIPGVKDNGGNLEFTCNYDATTYSTIKGKEGTESNFGVWFGDNAGTPDGHNGKFSFKGYPYVSKKGGGVNEVSEMIVGIIPTTGVTFSAS